MDSETLPVVDFSILNLNNSGSGDVSELRENGALQSIAIQLFDALQRYGCCHLLNSGIQKSKFVNMKKLVKEVFDLPQEVKKRLKRRPDTLVHGYITIDEERPEVKDSVENYEVFMTCPAKAFDWPNEVRGFKEAALDLHGDYEEFSFRVLDVLGIGMGLKNPTFFRNSHAKGMGEMRKSIYHSYPTDYEPKPDDVRFFPHCDIGTIALVSQDDIGGLQVKSHSSGEWLDATPPPNGVVLICGQMLQRWTSDGIRAPLHRVAMPTDQKTRSDERFSITFFALTENDFLFESLDGSNKYEPMTLWECCTKYYAKGKFADM